MFETLNVKEGMCSHVCKCASDTELIIDRRTKIQVTLRERLSTDRLAARVCVIMSSVSYTWIG